MINLLVRGAWLSLAGVCSGLVALLSVLMVVHVVQAFVLNQVSLIFTAALMPIAILVVGVIGLICLFRGADK